MKKISFQGELGAYSHLACQNVFSQYETIPCRNFEDALNCVSNDESEMAMIPVENTVAGRVADIHTLLGNSNLKIYAEHFEKVRHQLIVRPDASLSELKNVRSHVMGIGQCKKIIEELALTPIIMADTAGSAKDLSEGKDKSIAAIASKLSAEIYKLKILEENIEDEKDNVTRFLIMGKNIQQPDYKKEKKYITTCIFRLKSEPSSLYKSLGGFATNQINLVKLESFSVKNTFEQVNFYLDFEGHLEDKAVQQAMEELGFHTVNLDILGVYEASKFRQK